MGLLPFSDSADEEKEYGAYRLEERFNVPVADLRGDLLEIHPYKENDGIEAGANLLQALHDVQVYEGDNISDAHSFEIWFDRGTFKFRLYAANPRASERFKRRVTNTYTNSEVTELSHCKALPPLDAGYFVSGAYVDEERHTFLPIRHHEAEGFPHGDPYSDIMGEMLSMDDSIVVLQVVFKPARKRWTEKGPNGESVNDIAESLRTGEVVGFKDPLTWLGVRDLEQRTPSDKDKQAAKIVEDQRGAQGFHTNIRILAASPSPHEVRERARGLGSMFAKYYNAGTEQGLDHHPVPGDKQPTYNHLYSLLDRRWIDHEIILSIDELAGVAHIPNADIEVPQIPWKTTQTGSQISADAEKDEQQTADTASEWASDDGEW